MYLLSSFVVYLYCIFKYAKRTKVLDEEDIIILQSNFLLWLNVWTYLNAIIQLGVLLLIFTLLFSTLFNFSVLVSGNIFLIF